MTFMLTSTLDGVMVAAALIVEGLFAMLHVLPHGVRRGAALPSITLNYTTVLNGLFGVLSIGLDVVHRRSGGHHHPHGGAGGQDKRTGPLDCHGKQLPTDCAAAHPTTKNAAV
jgi:hypothetical protein